MNAPLRIMTVVPGGAFGVVAVPGTGLPDVKGINRHIGVDLRASIGTEIYAPDAGMVTAVKSIGLKSVEMRIGGHLHRFLHLSRNTLKVGDRVARGQLIGYSGDSGGVDAHLHWDVRKDGTAWNDSFYNYVDPMSLLEGEIMPEIVSNSLAQFLGADILGYDGIDGRASAFKDPAKSVLIKAYAGKPLTEKLIVDMHRSTQAKKYRETLAENSYEPVKEVLFKKKG